MLASSVKSLVATLGQESIYLWHAVLCKKKVIMYSASPERLQHAVRAVPLLVWHRNSLWSALRPMVNLDSMVELADLKTTPTYVAGFTDANVRGHEELYDLWIDLDTGVSTISDKAQNDFLLCSVHKDVGKYITETANTGDPADQQEMIKGLCAKTKQIVAKLDSLKSDHGLGKNTIAREDLEAIPGKNMSDFLWQVANGENMIL